MIHFLQSRHVMAQGRAKLRFATIINLKLNIYGILEYI